MIREVKRFLIGKPLRNEDALGEKLPKWKALPIFSSDALSSASYGPEQIAQVLAVSGLVTYGYYSYAFLPVIILLIIVTISYTQVTKVNPGGGGSYSVAKNNLGETPALIAGASLFSDYVLTVAVSIAAGTAAFTSAFPAFFEYKLTLDLLVLFCFLMLVNLRGVRESAQFFVYPTYLFVFSMFIIIAIGVFNAVTSTEPVIPIASTEKQDLNWVVVFLIMRAFANGCSSMTGLEAISNGVGSFKEPSHKNAIITTYWMSGLLIVMLCGISFLLINHHIMPIPGVTMLSQITEMTVGRGVFYYFTQTMTMLILFIAANTAYNGLPPLMSIMAEDGYMPRYLGQRGERLSFSNGIFVLSAAAGLLIIIFDGDIEHLISLYAIGVFLSFTIAQSALVVHWHKYKEPGWHFRAFINGLGALITGIVVLIIAVSKFFYGAWIILIIIPSLVFIFKKIKEHYTTMSAEIVLTPKELLHLDEPIIKNYVVIPVGSPTRSVAKAIKYAKKIGDKIIVVHISTISHEAAEEVKAKWIEWEPDVEIEAIYSPYRMVINPLVKYIKRLDKKMKPGEYITVLIPEIHTHKWWHRLLHNQTGLIIRTMLFYNTNVAITTIPFKLEN